MGRPELVWKRSTSDRNFESKEVAPSTAPSLAPIRKKRGRPRKVIKEEILTEDMKKGDALSNEVSQQNLVSDSGNKCSRSKAVEGPTDTRVDVNDKESMDHLDEPAVTPILTRRQGSRRKSAPRRAAGSFFNSRWHEHYEVVFQSCMLVLAIGKNSFSSNLIADGSLVCCRLNQSHRHLDSNSA